MSRLDDEEDWVGTPPEGRHSRDRAKPDLWWHQRPVQIAGAGLAVLIVVAVVLLLTR